MTGSVPGRAGNTHPTICPYETFPTSSSYINIAVGNDRLFKKFSKLLDHAPWSEDKRFSSNPERVKNREELFKLISDITLTKPREEWLEIFDKEGIPAGPVYSIDEAVNHPQVVKREMVQEVSHSTLGTIKQTGIPVKLESTKGSIKGPPPTHGEHSIRILKDLGYSDNEISVLKRDNVIKDC